MTEQGRVANLPEYLYTYRRHAQSVCATRYELMCEKLREVLGEAYVRRGLPLPADLTIFRSELPARQSLSNQYRHWACHAIREGEPAIARRHALAALRRSPWSLQSWRVFAWSLAA